jgi:hypothetical protein
VAEGAAEDEAKDKRVDAEHQEWSEKSPEEAQKGSPIALLNLTAGELKNEVFVSKKVPQNPPGCKEIDDGIAGRRIIDDGRHKKI